MLLPIYGVTTGVSNTIYSARRNRVENFVRANHAQILEEIRTGHGTVLMHAMDLSGVPTTIRPSLIRQMQQDITLYRQVDPLVVTLMVYGN